MKVGCCILYLAVSFTFAYDKKKKNVTNKKYIDGCYKSTDKYDHI